MNVVKNFQQFEASIKWYSKGELSDDPSSKEFVEEPKFSIGDLPYMKEPKAAIYRLRYDGVWYEDDSRYIKGEKIGSPTSAFKEIYGEECVRTAISYRGDLYYKTSHLSKTENEALEEQIKWYSKGELSDDPNSKPAPIFYSGQKIILIDKVDAYWDGFKNEPNFRNSVQDVGREMIVDRDELKEIEGHLCVHCSHSGWYKISCVETT